MVPLRRCDNPNSLAPAAAVRAGFVPPSRTTASAKLVTISYNALDQLTQVKRYNDLAGTSLAVTDDYAYDNASRLTSLTHKNAAGTTLASYANSSNNTANRVTTRGDSFQTGSADSTTYTYDAAGQLTVADHASQNDENFTFDKAGNRTNTGYATGTFNQLTSDGTYTYQYDNEGNRTRRTDGSGNYVVYGWDYRNRLTSVVAYTSANNKTSEVRYTYDAADQRIGRQVDADGNGTFETIERYLWSGGELALVVNTSGLVTERTLHGPQTDLVLAVEKGTGGVGTLTWLLADHQGTVRDVVSTQGVVQDHLVLDAYGKLVSQTAASSQPRFVYTGREYESETGLTYLRERYYDAAAGRFVSEDPVGFAAGDGNLYRYVGNCVVNATDPSGLQLTTPYQGFAGSYTSATTSLTAGLGGSYYTPGPYYGTAAWFANGGVGAGGWQPPRDPLFAGTDLPLEPPTTTQVLGSQVVASGLGMLAAPTGLLSGAALLSTFAQPGAEAALPNSSPVGSASPAAVMLPPRPADPGDDGFFRRTARSIGDYLSRAFFGTSDPVASAAMVYAGSVPGGLPKVSDKAPPVGAQPPIAPKLVKEALDKFNNGKNGFEVRQLPDGRNVAAVPLSDGSVAALYTQEVKNPNRLDLPIDPRSGTLYRPGLLPNGKLDFNALRVRPQVVTVNGDQPKVLHIPTGIRTLGPGITLDRIVDYNQKNYDAGHSIYDFLLDLDLPLWHTAVLLDKGEYGWAVLSFAGDVLTIVPVAEGATNLATKGIRAFGKAEGNAVARDLAYPLGVAPGTNVLGRKTTQWTTQGERIKL